MWGHLIHECTEPGGGAHDGNTHVQDAEAEADDTNAQSDEQTEVSSVTEFTDDRAREIAATAGATAAKNATQLLMKSIREAADNSHGSDSEHFASLLGFSACQTGVVYEAFNLANIGIPNTWLLLDSQSTIHLITNPELLSNIRTASATMAVNCNAGVSHTNQEGDLLGFEQDTAWYYPRGIANVVSLALAQQHYRVVYDSQHGNAFKLYRSDGSLFMTFIQSERGLYYCDLAPHLRGTSKPQLPDQFPDQPPSSRAVVCTGVARQEATVMVATVDGNKEPFTRRAVKRAEAARKLKRAMFSPSDRDMCRIVDNRLVTSYLRSSGPVTSSGRKAMQSTNLWYTRTTKAPFSSKRTAVLQAGSAPAISISGTSG